MEDFRTGKDLKDIPELAQHQYYIYVMENEIGKIKIGRTGNIYERYLSLCGSNSQGNQITRVYCSPSTYLYTLERIAHQKFDAYRIHNTEWFFGEGLYFEDVVDFLNDMFVSDAYDKCNELRATLYKGVLI